jgi:hypothetical protein
MNGFGFNPLQKGRATTIVVAASDSSTRSKRGADYICDGSNDEVTIQSAVNALPVGGGKIVLMEGNYSKGNATGISLPSNVEIELMTGATFTIASGLNVDACFFTNADKVNGNNNIRIIGGGKFDCNFRNQTNTTYQYLADFELVSNGLIDVYITNYTMLEAKLKQSKVEVINRKFLQKPYVLAPCESIDEFTVSAGTAITEVGGGLLGDNCIKITADTTSTVDVVLPTEINENYDAYEVGLYVKCTDPTLITAFVIGADTGSGADDFGIKMNNKAVNKLFEAGKWHFIKAPLNRYVLSTVPKFRISITSSSATDVYISKIVLTPAPMKASLTWIWDDALTSAYTGTKIMGKYGHRGAIAHMGAAYIDDLAGTYLTTAEIDIISKELGWDICVHTDAHFEPEVTLAEARETLLANKKFIEQNGWKGSNYLVFGGHDTRGEITSLTKKIFTAFRNPAEGTPVVRTDLINRSIQITTFTAPSVADKFMLRRHLWVHNYSHGVGGSQVSEEALEAWCQFWYDWGLISQPPSEIIGDYTPRYEYEDGWIEPTLEEPWEAVGTVRYMKDALGFVHIKGRVTGGSSGSTILILPAGYRPKQTLQYAVSANGSLSYIMIENNGRIIRFSGAYANINLDVISFKAEQ